MCRWILLALVLLSTPARAHEKCAHEASAAIEVLNNGTSSDEIYKESIDLWPDSEKIWPHLKTNVARQRFASHVISIGTIAKRINSKHRYGVGLDESPFVCRHRSRRRAQEFGEEISTPVTCGYEPYLVTKAAQKYQLPIFEVWERNLYAIENVDIEHHAINAIFIGSTDAEKTLVESWVFFEPASNLILAAPGQPTWSLSEGMMWNILPVTTLPLDPQCHDCHPTPKEYLQGKAFPFIGNQQGKLLQMKLFATSSGRPYLDMSQIVYAGDTSMLRNKISSDFPWGLLLEKDRDPLFAYIMESGQYSEADLQLIDKTMTRALGTSVIARFPYPQRTRQELLFRSADYFYRDLRLEIAERGLELKPYVASLANDAYLSDEERAGAQAILDEIFPETPVTN